MLKRMGWAMVDQGLSSASNVVFLIAIARLCSIEEFGELSLAYAILVFGLGVLRGTLGTLVSVEGSSSGRIGELPLIALVWALLMVGIGAASSLLVDPRHSFFALLISVVVIYPQDILRYFYIANLRPVRAVFSDGIWLTASLSLLLTSVLVPTLSPLVAIGIWAGGALLALLSFIPSARGVRPAHPKWVGLLRTEARVLLLHALLVQSAPLMVATAMAAFMDVRDLAALRGGSTLIGPVSLLMSAVPLVVVPELVRASGKRRSRLAQIQSLAMMLLVTLWGVGISLLPPEIGVEIIGETWQGTISVWYLIVLEYGMWALASGGQAWLQSNRKWSVLLHVRLIYFTGFVLLLALSLPSGRLDLVLGAVLVAAAVHLLFVARGARGIGAGRLG